MSKITIRNTQTGNTFTTNPGAWGVTYKPPLYESLGPVSTPSSTPSTPSSSTGTTTVSKPPSAISSTTSTAPSAGSAPTLEQQAAAAKAARAAHVATLQISPIPEVAALQRLAQQKFVDTGIWDDALTKQADAIRAGLNPMYPGGGKGFNEGQYILGGGTGTTAVGDFFANLFGGAKNTVDAANSPANNGTVGLILIGAIALLIFRGGRR